LGIFQGGLFIRYVANIWRPQGYFELIGLGCESLSILAQIIYSGAVKKCFGGE